MFGLSIVKTADLNNLKARVADLETDVDGALDQVTAIRGTLKNLANQVQGNDTATRASLAKLDNAVLAKPKVCPMLTATPKHVVDPVGAWESKQRVLEARLKSATDDVRMFERQALSWRGLDYELAAFNADLSRKAQIKVGSIKQDLYEHGTRKPIVVQLAPPSETAVFVRHKKYGTLGLLKGNHITILSKGNQLDVGDVILNATPNKVHKFWNIELCDSVKLSV